MKNLRLPAYSELTYDRLHKTNLSIMQWHIANYILFLEMQFVNRKVHSIQNIIANAHRCTVRSVQRNIDILVSEGFIAKDGNRIQTTEKWLNLITDPSDELPIAENVEDVESDESEKGTDSIDIKFNRFYSLYPRKEKREVALKTFKSKKLYQRIEELVIAVNRYVLEKSDTEKQFLMLPATFLNNKIWEEYVSVSAEEAKKIGSGAAKVSNDPIFDLVQKCMRLKSEWFDTLVYEKNSSQMSAADVVEDGISYFSDIEINVINEIGFKLMLRECTDGDFVVSSVVPVWERLSK